MNFATVKCSMNVCSKNEIQTDHICHVGFVLHCHSQPYGIIKYPMDAHFRIPVEVVGLLGIFHLNVL